MDIMQFVDTMNDLYAQKKHITNLNQDEFDIEKYKNSLENTKND